MHQDALAQVQSTGSNGAILREAQAVWDGVRETGRRQGYRNSQVTVLAPTGTI